MEKIDTTGKVLAVTIIVLFSLFAAIGVVGWEIPFFATAGILLGEFFMFAARKWTEKHSHLQ